MLFMLRPSNKTKHGSLRSLFHSPRRQIVQICFVLLCSSFASGDHIYTKSEHVTDVLDSWIAQLVLNLMIMIIHSFQLCIHACLHRCAVQCQKIPIRICFPSRTNKSLLSSLLIQLFQVIV